MRDSFKKIDGVYFLAGTSLLFCNVHAQDAPTEPDAIADIVVTARRVSENVQTVPVTVAAFSGDALREASINRPQDLQQSVPGIFLGGSGAPENSNYAIRGATKPVAGAGAPGVVTYFADVPLPSYVSSTPQYDVGSIQVLKGPQGTLFGRNTVGGAVLIDPVAPSDAFDGYVQGTYGNYDSRSLEGAVNVPLIQEKADLRVAGRFDRADAYVKNIGTGRDLENQHDNNFRISLLLKPTDWLRNLTIFDYADQPKSDAGGAAQIALTTGLSAFQPLLDAQQARGRYKVDAGTLNVSSGWRAEGVTDRADIDLGGISITNIFGFRKVYNENVSNFDGLPGGIFDTYQLIRNKQYTDELQIKGHAMDSRLEWLLGGFYLDSPNGTIAYDSDLSVLGAPNAPVGYNFYSEKSKSLFANLSFELVQGLKLNGGYRYTWDSYSSCSGTSELDAPARRSPGDCPSGLAAGSEVRGESKAPTWTVGIDWQVSDELFAYLTSRRGYKSGGINAPLFGSGLSPLQTFEPERTTDIELGAKSKFSVGGTRIRLNGSVFRAKTKGLQIIGTSVATSSYQAAGLACVPPSFTPFIDGDCNSLNDPIQTVITINGGDVTNKGLELEATLSPFEGLVLSGSATFLDSDTDRKTIPAVLAPFFPTGDIPLLFTPKKSYTATLAYTLPLSADVGELAFNAQYYYSSSIDFSNLIASPYDVVNARLDWNGIAGTSVDASLFARNLFKEEYITGPGLTPANAIPVQTALFGAPRTYGVQVRYRFGAAASR